MGRRKKHSYGYAPGIRVDENGTTIFLQCIISRLGECDLSFEVRRPKSASLNSFAPSRRRPISIDHTLFDRNLGGAL